MWLFCFDDSEADAAGDDDVDVSITHIVILILIVIMMSGFGFQWFELLFCKHVYCVMKKEYKIMRTAVMIMLSPVFTFMYSHQTVVFGGESTAVRLRVVHFWFLTQRFTGRQFLVRV